MNKKELIENFLDNRSFRIPVEDLDIARNALGLLIDSIKTVEREKCVKKIETQIEQVILLNSYSKAVFSILLLAI